jgi:choice-of-anchor C domain-containing protein
MLMNRAISVASLGIWLLLVSGVSAQVPASLIVNGSFERGPNVGAFLNLAAGNTALPGWVVTGEGVDYVSTGYWVSSDGARAIDLDGSARSVKTPPYVQGGIAQTFSTKPAVRYRVTFDLAGNPNQLPEVKRFRISAAGQSAEMSFNAKGKTARSMGWQKTTWTFTASGAMTTLEFRSLTVSPQTGYGAAIDNVSVVEDSEPLVEMRESDREIRVQFGSEVLFDTGKFDLKPAASELLRRLATLLTERATAPVVID